MPRFIYNDIGGGLNQGQPPQTLADREWVSHVNFYPRGTKVRRRGGLRRLATAHTERVTGVLAFRPTTGSVQTILGSRTAIAELDGGVITALPAQTGFAISDSTKPWTSFEYKNIAYWVRELSNDLVRSDGTYYGPSGIAAPSAAPTLAAGAAGDIPAADFIGVYTFYNPTTGVESNPSPASAVYTHAGSLKIDWSGIAVSTNTQVTARRLYRTLPDQTGEYYFVAQIDNNTDTTFTGDNVLVQDLGEAVSFSNGMPPSGLHFGTVWKERGFFSDKVDVMHSELGRIECFDGETNIISVFPDDGHEIRALHAYGDRLVIGKTNKIHYLVGTDPDNFALLTLSDRHGCASHHSMQSAEGVLLWLGLDNFYRSDGNSVTGLASVKLQEIIAALGPDTLEYATATVFPSRNWYVCIIPDVATVVYNYKTDAWAEFEHDASLQGIFDHFTDDFVQDMYAADDAGYVYRFADETYNFDDNGATLGAAIDCEMESKPQEAGNPGAVAVMSRVGLAAQQYAEEITLSWVHEGTVLNTRTVSLDHAERWKVYALSSRQGAKGDTRLRIGYAGATMIELEGWFVDADSIGRLSTRPH